MTVAIVVWCVAVFGSGVVRAVTSRDSEDDCPRKPFGLVDRGEFTVLRPESYGRRLINLWLGRANKVADPFAGRPRVGNRRAGIQCRNRRDHTAFVARRARSLRRHVVPR